MRSRVGASQAEGTQERKDSAWRQEDASCIWSTEMRVCSRRLESTRSAYSGLCKSRQRRDFILSATRAFLKIILFIYLLVYFIGCAGLCCFAGFSLVGTNGGYSLLAAWALLIAVAFLLWSTGSRHMGFSSCAPRFQSTGSVVVLYSISSSMVCGVFLDQELNPYLLYWQAVSWPMNP